MSFSKVKWALNYIISMYLLYFEVKGFLLFGLLLEVQKDLNAWFLAHPPFQYVWPLFQAMFSYD